MTPLSEAGLVAIAHRGLSGEHPDNSAAAFEAAIAAGYGIETDVRRTRDGVLVLVHDPVVAGRQVAGITYDELRELDPRIVTLAWLLERCGPDVLLVVEIKHRGVGDEHGAIEEAVVRELGRWGRLGARTVVSSFSPSCLLKIAELAPGLHRFQVLERLRNAATREILDIVRGYAGAIAPDVADLFANGRLVDEAHARGLGVFPYPPSSLVTRDDHRAAAEAIVRTGCDGGHVNYPDIDGAMPEFPVAPSGVADAVPVGRLAALLVANGSGRNLSVADLREAEAYAPRLPEGAAVVERCERLMR